MMGLTLNLQMLLPRDRRHLTHIRSLEFKGHVRLILGMSVFPGFGKELALYTVFTL